MAWDWVWRTDGYYVKNLILFTVKINRQGDVQAKSIKIRVEVCLKIELKCTCVVVFKPMQ